ncbi:MAG TPA: winged helix-turn-helix domain-containing protein [Nitrososphaerales archaeon]|nr:winged helix-turn-helix domain-containing protein [Nitrososphaerales archaeon]
MIRRSRLAIGMEILAALSEGPLNSSRLAQRCNINYGRLDEDLKPILALGWVTKEISGAHDLHKLTDAGLKALTQYLVLWNEWERGTKLTGGQQAF